MEFSLFAFLAIAAAFLIAAWRLFTNGFVFGIAASVILLFMGLSVISAGWVQPLVLTNSTTTNQYANFTNATPIVTNYTTINQYSAASYNDTYSKAVGSLLVLLAVMIAYSSVFDVERKR